MAYLFPSQEWAEQLELEVNRSAAYASSAKTWEGDFYFLVEPAKAGEPPARMYVDLWHGKCRKAEIVDPQDARKPEFSIAGSMATYRRIFEHKLDPIQALMTRQLKLQGNMMKIMRAVKATLDLVNCCALIDTAYPEA
ncbi:MAG TPA: SCP2 sterol-binding domain-containing protein [Anaerolineae bacterium]